MTTLYQDIAEAKRVADRHLALHASGGDTSMPITAAAAATPTRKGCRKTRKRAQRLAAAFLSHFAEVLPAEDEVLADQIGAFIDDYTLGLHTQTDADLIVCELACALGDARDDLEAEAATFGTLSDRAMATSIAGVVLLLIATAIAPPIAIMATLTAFTVAAAAVTTWAKRTANRLAGHGERIRRSMIRCGYAPEGGAR